MDVLDQNTYKRRYSDKGCDFFLKNIIFTKKNAVFYEEKLFFAIFFWKKGNFPKEIASWKKPKETKKHKRPRTQSRIQTPFYAYFMRSQLYFPWISEHFHSNFTKILTPISEHFYSILASIIAFCQDYNT